MLKGKYMTRQPDTGSLAARLGLTGALVGQIFVTPLAAFGLTYLLVIDLKGFQEFNAAIEISMIPWIGLASLFYGMLALILALSMGGFSPPTVVNRGGWRLAAGLTRNPGSSSHIQAARSRYANSPHGQLTLLVHERYIAGHALWNIRGSLVLLAIPFQVLLATIPLALVLIIPSDIIHQNRQLELALILYAVCLFISIRLFPTIAKRYITFASILRRLLGSTVRITFLLPVILLWSMGQLATWIVQMWMGEDQSLNIQFEKELFESMISASPIPETSFLNLLTALAVMPMAAFTTLAVLGGGSGTPPEWMVLGSTAPGEPSPDDSVDSVVQSQVLLTTSDVILPAQTYTPAMVQQVVDHSIQTFEEAPQQLIESTDSPPMHQATESMELDREFLGSIEAAGSQKQVAPHDEPVIKGFHLEDRENP